MLRHCCVPNSQYTLPSISVVRKFSLLRDANDSGSSFAQGWARGSQASRPTCND